LVEDFVASHCVTPDSKNNEISNENKISFIDTSDIQCNLADTFIDKDNSSSNDSSIDINDEMSSDAEEDIIKYLPEDEITKETTNEYGMDAMFTAKVIEKLQHNEIREVSNEIENLFVGEDIHETCHKIAEASQFKDVPSVLLNGGNSVLFCNNTGNVEEELDKTKYNFRRSFKCQA